MVSIDTFGLVGATSAPCHALCASVRMARFVIAQTADGAMIFEAKQHLFVMSMRIKTGPKSCLPVVFMICDGSEFGRKISTRNA
jgi:hypothetical protein